MGGAPREDVLRESAPTLFETVLQLVDEHLNIVNTSSVQIGGEPRGGATEPELQGVFALGDSLGQRLPTMALAIAVRARRQSAPNALLMASSRLHLLLGVLISAMQALQKRSFLFCPDEPESPRATICVNKPTRHHRAPASQYRRRDGLGRNTLVLGRVAAVGPLDNPDGGRQAPA